MWDWGSEGYLVFSFSAKWGEHGPFRGALGRRCGVTQGLAISSAPWKGLEGRKLSATLLLEQNGQTDRQIEECSFY